MGWFISSPPLSYHTFRLDGEKASKGGAERSSFQGKIALNFCEKVLGRSMGSRLIFTRGGRVEIVGGGEIYHSKEREGGRRGGSGVNCGGWYNINDTLLRFLE